MTKKRLLGHLAYVGVGLCSLLMAVFIASRVVGPAHSQDTPPPPPPDMGSAPDAPPDMAPPETADAPPPPPPAPEEALQAAPQGVPPVDTIANPEAPAGPVVEGTDIPQDVSFLEPYVFDVREGRRNPFRRPVTAEGGLDMVLPGTPLERYDLDELRLAGIMWDVRLPRAMVIDPQGEVHVLGKDDRIGRKRGYVAAIREGEVVVVETTTFNGENTYSTRILRIDK